MAAADHEDREALAAEYVLGTLDPQERRDFDYQLRTDPDLKRMVEEWTERLHPLNEALAPRPVSPGLEARLLNRIAGLGRGGLVAMERSLRRWRATAMVTGALAAGLALVLLWLAPQYLAPPRAGGSFVATLQAEGADPAFVALVDLERRTIAIKRVAAAAPAGRSFELWALGGGRDSPESLGLVDADVRIPAAMLGDLATARLADTIFAITIEPAGGSPTGQPSGAPVYVGKLIPTQ